MWGSRRLATCLPCNWPQSGTQGRSTVYICFWWPSLNIHCCLLPKGYRDRELSDLTQGGYSGQQPYHTFFCLDVPLLHTQIHISAVYLLPCRKHNWKVLADSVILPVSHCLKARKVRKPKEVHWKSVRQTTQHRTAEKNKQWKYRSNWLFHFTFPLSYKHTPF